MKPAPPVPPAISTRARGQESETLAARFLEARGLVIVARNVRAGGVELDLVAHAPAGGEDRVDTLVFVEVRSREDERAGSPEETVDARKQARLRRGAAAWLVQQGLWEQVAVRFDVVAIVVGAAESAEAPKITWIPGAFDGSG